MFNEEQAVAEQEKRASDPFLWVRVVLLLAAGFSFFTLPWPVSFMLALAWILVMVWPRKTKE
jgi:hypothetical protein